jgi:PAS domain-containing protein
MNQRVPNPSVEKQQGALELTRALRDTERELLAETQIAILNSLPAHIALVDSQGIIVSVNEAWRRFGAANALQGANFGVGQNYLDLCEQ